MDIYKEIDKIFEKGINEYGNTHGFDLNGENRSITDLVYDFLDESKNRGIIKDFTVDSCEFDCGPSSEPGCCFVAWITNEGKLQSTSYEWENY